MKKISQMQSKGDRVFRLVLGGVLIVYAILIIYPMLNIISISLSDTKSVMRGEVSIFPIGLNLRAYEKMIQNTSLWRSYLNTIFIVVTGVAFGLLVSSFAAYSIAKKNLPGVGLVSFLFAAVLWFDAGIIPNFIVVNKLGLYDKLFTLVLVALFNPFYIFIMKGFFTDLPESIEESAIIDGANHIQILFKIILPVSKPLLATIGLWIAVYHWNAFLQPLIYLRSQSNFTLQMVLREIVLDASVEETTMDMFKRGAPAMDSVKYAAVILSVLPIMLAYPFLQKYFVKGVMLGAVKG